jgi:spore coat polysaccharide biosynthesis protein SpsF
MINSIFITVRTKSSRLPNKCLKTVNGKRIIDLVIERSKLSKKYNNIVLCTTTNTEDDVLEKIANDHKIGCYRGSELDKINRWVQAAKKYGSDNIVTFDADDPLCDPYLIDVGFEQLEKGDTDFIHNDKLLCGSFSFGFNSSSLYKVDDMKDSDDTEMMWPYFRDTGLFNCRRLDVGQEYEIEDIRLTLDYQEDFDLFEELFKNMEYNTSILDVVKYIYSQEGLKDINFFRQDQYKTNQIEKTKIILK